MAQGKAKAVYVDKSGDVRHRSSLSWEFLYRTSTVKDANYDVGDRVVLPDGRIFRYALSSGACHSGAGATNSTAPFIADDGGTTLAAATIVGDKSITIASQTIAVDALRGGYVIIYPDTVSNEDTTQFRGIVGNTVGAGTTITVYLDASLTVACGATSALCAYYSPYYGLKYGNDPRVSTLGIPATYVSATSMYFWVQTWGPCRCTPGAAGYGNEGDERQMVLAGNGALYSHETNVSSANYQHAGFIIPRTASADDAPLVMLQLSV